MQSDAEHGDVLLASTPNITSQYSDVKGCRREENMQSRSTLCVLDHSRVCSNREYGVIEPPKRILHKLHQDKGVREKDIALLY